MIRGGDSTTPGAFAKFVQRVNLAREHAAVPGRVGVWMLHGSNWSDQQVAEAYSLIRRYGMYPMDWRHDSIGKHWRR
jgi:hypothetical protein